MAETASTLTTWRVGGQIDEATANAVAELADIIVVATLVGHAGQNVVDPTNGAHVIRGPYTTVVGGLTGTATTPPAIDGNTTLAGRLWWTEPLKATAAVDPNQALQPSGLAWQIVVTAITRRGISHQLATFSVELEGDRDYSAEGETILVPAGTGGADVEAVGVIWLTEPPATVADNTFTARVLDVLADADGSGIIYAADYGVDPDKYALYNGTNGHSSMTAADSTADFQAAFNAAAAAHTTALGGVTLRFPKGRYLLIGTVTIPDMVGNGGFTVDMTDVIIGFKPQTTGDLAADPPQLVMFRTTTPTSSADAEVKNDVRDMWTWRGGFYDGDRVAGEIGFELNAVSRMVMERVNIQGYDTGIHGRFVLHYKLRDSRVQSCKTYGVRIQAESGAWTGVTAANAASNGTIFENVRFYGNGTETAQLLVAHSGHTVKDCTFEGAGPAEYNYVFTNENTSVLTSKIENLWIENTPGTAHLKIRTPHQFEFDIQYSNTDAVVADIWQSSLCTIRRMPWPQITTNNNPRFKVNSLNATGSGVNVAFDHSGVAGAIEPQREQLWADRVFPSSITSYGRDGNGKAAIFMSGGGGSSPSRGQVWKLTPPANSTPGLAGTVATDWVLVHQPAAPVNTVAPVASGTATVGSTLSVTDGTWTGSPTPAYSYQWNRGGVAISGATAATYLLDAADVGATITATVTGTNVKDATTGVQTASATSNGIGPIT